MKYFYKYLTLCILVFFGATGYGQVLITEDFDAGTSFPQGWMSPTLPAFTITSSQACSGNSARGPLNPNSIVPELAYMNEEGATGEDIIVSFDYKILQNATGNPATTGDFGSFELQYSIDDGHSWTTYFTIDQTTHTSSTTCATLTHTISGTDVPAGSEFAWKIKGSHNQGSHYIYIDNFSAIEQVSCLQPVGLTVGDVTFDSIEISWTEFNATPATEWEIAYCPEGTNPSQPACFLMNIITVTSNPYTITGLQDGTKYDIYIRSVCGAGDNSAWSEFIQVQTIALGTDCVNPLPVTSLPFTHTSDTEIYDNNYSGTPGTSCSTAGSFLQGNDVVYHYNSAQDDIIQIELSGNLTGAVGVFVYEACSDIGNECFAGAITDNGNPFAISDLFIEANKDYYIVISTSGANTTTEYKLDITGFNCLAWIPPSGDATYEFSNQTLDEYSETRVGVHPTIQGAVLTWYSDAALSNEITDLSSVVLADNDEFWVTQTVMGCTSPALHVTFLEFDCSDLSITSVDATSQICDEGSTILVATAATDNLIWYAQETGGNAIGIGASFETPEITQTTSYWVSEFFLGESFLTQQANPGPVKNTSASVNGGVEFVLSEPSYLADVQIYVTGASGDLTIQLEDNKGSIQTKTINVPGGTVNSPKSVTIPLDFDLPNPNDGPFRLTKTSGPSMLMTESSDASFPYVLGNVGNVTGGLSGSSKNSNYYYFYNWTITSLVALCESDRMEVQAVVNETKPIAISADEYSVCVGNAVGLTVTSDDADYDYTWEWLDNNGVRQTLTGATINPVVGQGTTFTAKAVNPNTGCSTQEEIFIEVVGVGEIPIFPITMSVCVGEVVELHAGQIKHTFNDTITDWTFNNNSSPATGVLASVANWKQVTSPYTLADNATSNDASSFMITMADPLGPASQVDTEMISPPINLVGVQNAELEFYHFYKHHTTKTTTARVQVSDDAGLTWTTVESYSTNRGTATDFEKVTIDLNPYLGSANVQVKFKYTGGWGWWWAVDNVSISQSYMNGQVVWDNDGIGIQNLYLDEQATISYQGQPTNIVYFKAEDAGIFEFDANLLISGCTDPVNNSVVIEVNKADKPVGATEQEFTAGARVADIDVVGTNLMFYLLVDNKYVRQSINATLINNETYYISQRIGECVSEFLEVTVSFACPDPTNLKVTVDLSQDGITAAAIVFWDPPTNTQGLDGYQLYIKDSEGQILEDYYLGSRRNYQVVDGLPLNEDFTVELYSICDAQNNVFGNTLTDAFTTRNLNVGDFQTLDFAYYPNPVSDLLHIDSEESINMLEVYSYDGKQVLSMNVSTKNATIDLSELTTGTYLLVARSETKSNMVRVIKK